MTIPTLEQTKVYAEELVALARTLQDDPTNRLKRAAFYQGVFNLDWAAAVIVFLADRRTLQ